ncbi:MAG: BT4734/BF3469 family protein [Bacteroidia bacterium]|nr:BT4734/BF3469 family protein [Bacteroidia bacterium]
MIKGPFFKQKTILAQKKRKLSLSDYQDFKAAHFPAFLPHARIDPEKNKNLANCSTHSGLLAIEYDKLLSSELLKAKALLSSLPWISLIYTSISGKGLCAFVYLPHLSLKNHSIYYEAVASYLDNYLDLCHDPSGANLNRLRFFSYDPEVYFNPSPLPCPVKPTAANSLKNVPPKNYTYGMLGKESREYHLLRSIYQKLRDQGLALFSSYTSWLQGAYALINTFHLTLAKELFHLLASLSPGYKFFQAEEKLSKVIESIKRNIHSSRLRLGFGSLIYLLKKAIQGSSLKLWQFYRKRLYVQAQKELFAFMPGTAIKLKLRRAKLLRFMHRYAGLEALAPHLSTLKYLSHRFKVSPSQISSDLKALKEAGLITITLQEKHSLNRAHKLQLSEKALDLLCRAKNPPAKELAIATKAKNTHLAQSGPSSNFKPLYINIPLEASTSPSSSSSKNKKREIPAQKQAPDREREGSRGGKTHLPPQILPIARKAWEKFCASLAQTNTHNRPGPKTAQLFAKIALKHPQKIYAIAQQIVNKSPGKTPYFWLYDHCYSLNAHGPILNYSLSKQDLEKLSRMKVPPAERMRIISREDVDFPVLSLQGWSKYPLSVPSGIVYCTSIKGKLWLNQGGRKVIYGDLDPIGI